MQLNMGVFPSGQRGQTVNLLSSTSVVRIHPLPPSVVVYLDATPKSLEKSRLFLILLPIFKLQFHRCQRPARWIRTTETKYKGQIQ